MTKDELILTLAERVFVQHEILGSLAMKNRKVSAESTYNRNKDRMAQEYGQGLYAEGTPWSEQDVFTLLTLFLVHEARYASMRPQNYLNCLGRSPKSIYSQLWKLAARYNRPSVNNFTDLKLFTPNGNRNLEPWTEYDYALIEHMTSPVGVNNGAHTAEWAARVLGREVEFVHARYDGIEPRRGAKKYRKELLDRAIVNVESYEVKRAMKVWRAVAGKFDYVTSESGLK